jgi:hypothetical protein
MTVDNFRISTPSGDSDSDCGAVCNSLGNYVLHLVCSESNSVLSNGQWSTTVNRHRRKQTTTRGQ